MKKRGPRELYARGELDGALAACGPADNRPEAAAWRGVVLRAMGRGPEAAVSLQAAARTGKAPAWAHAVLGEIYRELGARLRGYGEIQRALKLDPDAARSADFPGLGPEREQAWAFGLRGGAARGRGDLAAAERDLRAAVELDAGCGWAWGWLGELLLKAGRLEEAVEALDRAVGLFVEWPDALAWRGEALRLLGRPQEAVADLDAALSLGFGRQEIFLSRAAARATLGDASGQLADLTRAVRLSPKAFEEAARRGGDHHGTRWVRGVLYSMRRAERHHARAEEAAGRGRSAEALKAWGECLKADPENVAALLARSETLSGSGRLREALRDAEKAVALEPSAETYSRRADVEQRLGYMEAALRDTSLAAALAPSASLLQWRARTFLGMRHYDLALKDLAAALELEPDNGDLYDLMAHVNLLLGRVARAQRDVEAALRLAPGHGNLHLRLGQLLALQGRFSQARRSVGPIRTRLQSWYHFTVGYVCCIEKRYAAAGREFDAARRLARPEEGHLGRQALFYAAVTKALGAPNVPFQSISGRDSPFRDGEERMGKTNGRKVSGAAREKGKVYLCGLGVYPPQTATVEVLRGISECDVIFNNLPGMGISEFLGLFCANRRPVAFRYEQDAKLCADLVLSEVRPGRTVGFVTFGHPMLFGPLSHEIIKRCRKEGIPCKAFGAVSSMDAVLAASGQVLGYSYGGYQLFETTGTRVLDDIAAANPRLPMVVYFADGMGHEWLGAFVRTMQARYPREHACLFYGPKHELWETSQDKITLKQLAEMNHHRLAQGILFVPPLGEIQ